LSLDVFKKNDIVVILDAINLSVVCFIFLFEKIKQKLKDNFRKLFNNLAMKFKQFSTSLILFFIFVITPELKGQTYFIIPHTGNSFKLQNKNDLSLAIGGYINDGGSQVIRNQQIQLGYAPFKNFGIAFFHSKIKNLHKNGTGPTIHNSKLSGLEIGTFYGLKFNKRLNWRYSKRSLKQRQILGSFYAGYSNGKLNNNYFDFDDSPERLDASVEMNLHKYYIHTGIHWIGRRFEFSGLVKTGKVNFYQGIIDGQSFGNDFEDISKIVQNNTFTFQEYTLKAEYNFNVFGLYGQVTSSSIKSFKGSPIVTGDIGIVFYLDVIKKNFEKRRQLKEFDKS